MVSLAPRVSAARTAIPSMPAASNGGEDRVAHTGSAVTRPVACASGTRCAGSLAGQPACLARGTPGIEGAGGGHVAEERATGHDHSVPRITRTA